MSRFIEESTLAVRDEIALAPNVRQDVDRTFGLPVGLHTAYFGAFIAYLGIMAVGFPSPHMILPMAIFILFVVAAYAVPMAWATMQPDKKASAISMGQLFGSGIVTETGLTKGKDAVAQVLILPLLIVGWGIAAVSIAALV